MSKSLFSYVTDSVNKRNLLESKIREHLAEQDIGWILDGCREVEAKHPVDKRMNPETGKQVDVNRDQRNGKLSAIRTALKRVGRPQGFRYLVNKDTDGNWQFISEPWHQEQAEPEPEESNGGSNDADSKQSDELWEAVDIVLANMHNAAVLSAIKGKLQQMAG